MEAQLSEAQSELKHIKREALEEAEELKAQQRALQAAAQVATDDLEQRHEAEVAALRQQQRAADREVAGRNETLRDLQGALDKRLREVTQYKVSIRGGNSST